MKGFNHFAPAFGMSQSMFLAILIFNLLKSLS